MSHAEKQSERFWARWAISLGLTWPYLLVLTGLFVLAISKAPLLSPVPVVLGLFVLFFFRNPKRMAPPGDNLVLAPADGRIIAVDTVYEDKYVKGETTRVAIFLSLYNVHINRSPLAGVVKYRYYRPGKFIPAFKSHASEINEKNFIGIEGKGYKIMVSQITGFIARRITCWVNEGACLTAGAYLGVIRFGSGSEVFLPPEARILVKQGDRVIAGETVIGVLPEPPRREAN